MIRSFAMLMMISASALVVFAASPVPSAQPDDQSEISTPVVDPTESDVISTELSGVDSLNIVPDTMITKYQGGTRRVHLERQIFRRENPVHYAANGRRDPFRALVVDEKKEGEIVTDLLRLEGAVLTGVVWSDGQYVAMVRDKDGGSFLLHEGDPIYSGRVTAVTQTHAVFDIVEFGDYQQIVLKVAGSDKAKIKS